MYKTSINISNFLEKSPIKFILEEQANLLKIYYKNAKGGQPTPIFFDKKLVVNQEFFAGFGLYLGECEKGRSISFTNSDINILRFIIDWLEKYIGIDKNLLRANVISPRIDKNPDEINGSWSKKLSLGIYQFNKVSFPKTSPGNIERVRLCKRRILYQKILDTLTPVLFTLCLKNENFGKGFLRGYYSAEGCPVIRRTRNDTLNQINICGKDYDVLFLTHKLLLQQGINCKLPKKCKKGRNKDGQYEIDIFGYVNYKKLERLDIFKYSNKRKLIMANCLKNFKRVGVPERSNGLGLGG